MAKNELKIISIGSITTTNIKQQLPIEKIVVPFSKDIMLFSTYVAGTTHIENINEIVLDLNEGSILSLQREMNNQFDDAAILMLDEKKRKVGYVPKKDNIVFARLMDAGKFLFCKVTDFEEIGNWHKIYVDVFLKD